MATRSKRQAGSGPANLAFEDTELLNGGENLEPKRRVPLPAEDEGVQHMEYRRPRSIQGIMTGRPG